MKSIFKNYPGFLPLTCLLIGVILIPTFCFQAAGQVVPAPPKWDPAEVQFYESFLKHRDAAKYADAAEVANKWREHASKDSKLDSSYYAFVQNADEADFHERALFEAWQHLAKAPGTDPKQLIDAIRQWLAYLKNTAGENDPQTLSAYATLAKALSADKQAAEAIKELRTAKAAAEKATERRSSPALRALHVDILRQLGDALEAAGMKKDAKLITDEIKKRAASWGVTDRNGPNVAGGTGDPAAPSKGNYHQVRVFFGTDRKPTKSEIPADKFGGTQADGISYGSCTVSIPLKERRSPGTVPRPTWWKLEWREDPAKHITLLDLATQDKDAFYPALAAHMNEAAKEGGKKKAFVFVHGFNVTFAGAAYRTAQMAHDLEFAGTPIFFSWASGGGVNCYGADEEVIKLSQPRLEAFLLDVAKQTEAEEIYLVAHSMGARALTSAFAAVHQKLGAHQGRFKEIILAAPDIDREVFLTQIAPALSETKVPITVYASQNDKALQASKFLRVDRPRLGEDAAALAGLTFLEAIDASVARTDFLGHSHFSDDKTVIADLNLLIDQSQRPAQRKATLKEASSQEGGKFWKVKP